MSPLFEAMPSMSAGVLRTLSLSHERLARIHAVLQVKDDVAQCDFHVFVLDAVHHHLQDFGIRKLLLQQPCAGSHK